MSENSEMGDKKNNDKVPKFLCGNNGEGPHCDFAFCAIIGCFLLINADFENLHSLSAAFMR